MATEGIRPGIVAASHHMGRWRLEEDKARSWGAGKADIQSPPPPSSPVANGSGETGAAPRSASFDSEGGVWKLKRTDGISTWNSDDDDTNRIWWTDTGVHQNLTFSVQPDPISGMQCWHQRVHVTPAEPGDQYGDVVVDTNKSREAYLEWLEKTRPAPGPGGLRRPLWYARPLKPTAPTYLSPDA